MGNKNSGHIINTSYCLIKEATDSDDQTRLTSVAAAKILALKKWCPVILIVNLSDELVNGLTGEVMSYPIE
jgi:hypothetical protein